MFDSTYTTTFSSFSVSLQEFFTNSQDTIFPHKSPGQSFVNILSPRPRINFHAQVFCPEREKTSQSSQWTLRILLIPTTAWVAFVSSIFVMCVLSGRSCYTTKQQDSVRDKDSGMNPLIWSWPEIPRFSFPLGLIDTSGTQREIKRFHGDISAKAGVQKVLKGWKLVLRVSYFFLISSQLQSVTQEAIGLCVIRIAASTSTPQRSRTRPSRTWSVTTRCHQAGTDSGSTTSRRRCRPPALR